ncbi:MAG: hypothetical protein GF308_19515 [Candidatus Heimdallarchaeota archaeon]|nr:hypothetical protein [Candidatus Heimdallarchaeota archaeon]
MTEEKIEIENQRVFFKSAEQMEEIEPDSITLVVTSPPYWNAKDYGDVDQIGFGQSYQEYIESLNKVWAECVRVLQPNGKIAINVQPLPISAEHSGFGRRVIQNIMFDIEKFMREKGLFLSGMHYWDKAAYINNVSWGSYPKPTNIASNTSFEQIFVWVKKGKTRKIGKKILRRNLLKKEEWRHWAVRCIWDDIAPVIKIDSSQKNVFGHPAPFPEDIPYRMIKMHTVEEEKVLDPFLGSGTTLKVCRLLKREGYGYEINPEYKELIMKRIQESWTIPTIEEGYITVGNELMSKIIKETIDETWKLKSGFERELKVRDKKETIYKRILSNLKKDGTISTTFIEKMAEKKDDTKDHRLDDYFAEKESRKE